MKCSKCFQPKKLLFTSWYCDCEDILIVDDNTSYEITMTAFLKQKSPSATATKFLSTQPNVITAQELFDLQKLTGYHADILNSVFNFTAEGEKSV